MRRWNDPAIRVRWILALLGTAALALTFVLTGDITARFTAGFAYVSGLTVLVISEQIIVRTRNRPDTRLANARQGSIEH